MKSQLQGSGIARSETLVHDLGPNPPRRAELGDLFEELVVRVEEEAEPRREFVYCEPAPQGPFDIGDTSAEGVGEFLRGRGARFADVVAADRDWIEPRHPPGGELDRIGYEPHRLAGRIDVFLLGHELLEDVVLNSSRQTFPRCALLFGHDEIHRPKDGRGGCDRHRRGDIRQRDPVE